MHTCTEFWPWSMLERPTHWHALTKGKQNRIQTRSASVFIFIYELYLTQAIVSL